MFAKPRGESERIRGVLALAADRPTEALTTVRRNSEAQLQTVIIVRKLARHHRRRELWFEEDDARVA